MTTALSFRERASNVEGMLASQPLIRAINFHNTSRSRAAEYEQQLAHCSEHFSTVTEDDLDRYLQSGRWHKSKPGMILAFYEGYRNGYDVILPLLEHYGLVGWFFVITGFIDAARKDQLAYADTHGIGMSSREYADGRYALSWDEIREIDRSHVIASHALSHELIAPMRSTDREAEILGSQETLTAHLGHPVRSFVSRGGPAHGNHTETDALVDRAGYQFVFSNYKIQRLRD